MMRMRLVAALVGIAAISTPLGTRAAAPPPPLPTLRHIVFKFDVSVRQRDERRIETSENGAAVLNGTMLKRSASRGGSGKIVVDIVAVSNDGGLVADVTEDSVDRGAPRVRVAIHANGQLDYPPDALVNDEELELLRLLARGMVGSGQYNVGDSWNVDSGAADYADKTSFRVTDVVAPGEVGLSLDGSFKETGSTPFEGSRQGKLVYDTGKLVPLKGTLTKRMRLQMPTSYEIIDVSVDLSLLDDSFRK